jgi:hypothetical protein
MPRIKFDPSIAKPAPKDQKVKPIDNKLILKVLEGFLNPNKKKSERFKFDPKAFIKGSKLYLDPPKKLKKEVV